MVDDTEPEGESDLRRRAVWLLLMLAVVAVLLIIVISTVVGTDNGGNGGADGPRPLDSAVSSGSPATHHPGKHHRRDRPKNRTHSRTQHTSPTASIGAGGAQCPTSATCIVDGDVGNGIQAINDYRTQHGKPAVPGSVSQQAQTCALHNGSGCSGGWAETELPTPNGQQAVQKMLPFARLLDPMKSVGVGWAYDPQAKLYYFAIVRND